MVSTSGCCLFVAITDNKDDVDSKVAVCLNEAVVDDDGVDAGGRLGAIDDGSAQVHCFVRFRYEAEPIDLIYHNKK